ncbi:MAG: glutamate racemase [Candidatus Krumholzibacteria bacterium]|nr:glutamate racemase [Candidatus Krumholzibacteria bacterium]
MKEEDKSIGVFDSGVGGLTVVAELIRSMPGEDIVYFGDTARVPYGTKSPETVLRFARENLDFLKKKDVKIIVIACNTASSVALPLLLVEEDIPVTGVLLPGAKAAAAATENGRITIIGTSATIRSRAYEKELYRLNGDLEIRSLPCPLFVSLAEEGWLDGEITEMVVHRYLDSLAEFGADTLVLGCTHYPLLKGVISKVVGEGVKLVDSAMETALEVQRILERNNLVRDGDDGGRFDCYVSDTPYLFKEVGERFLGRPIDRVEHQNTGD